MALKELCMTVYKDLKINECSRHLDKQHFQAQGACMEVALDPDRYEIMTCIAGRTEEFRLAELYYLLKKQNPQKWKAKEVKISLEWLADMGLIKRKTVKASPGQAWLFYQPCFDHAFLHSRIKPEGSGNRAETRVYICRGIIEKLQYKYACIMERYHRVSWEPSYSSPFVIAEMEYVIPMTPEEKQLLKKKIEELD